jgi:hypothetical protein
MLALLAHEVACIITMHVIHFLRREIHVTCMHDSDVAYSRPPTFFPWRELEGDARIVTAAYRCFEQTCKGNI